MFDKISTFVAGAVGGGASQALGGAGSAVKNSAQQACGNACNNNTANQVFANIATALVFVIGAVSVIMIIVGGLQYVLSNGDAKRVQSAKNIVFYAIFGVVIAIMSWAIVRFVTNQIG